MAGLIIVPQIVVAVLAPWIGYWSEIWGRKPLLLCGLGLEALRALLFTVISDPLLILMVQLLDGITAAIVVVLTILVIADVTSGSGRFNLAQGAVGTLTAISSAVSTGILGVMVYNFGDVTGFLTMAMWGQSLLWLCCGNCSLRPSPQNMMSEDWHAGSTLDVDRRHSHRGSLWQARSVADIGWSL